MWILYWTVQMYFLHHRKLYWTAKGEVVEADRVIIYNYGQCRELLIDIYTECDGRVRL